MRINRNIANDINCSDSHNKQLNVTHGIKDNIPNENSCKPTYNQFGAYTSIVNFKGSTIKDMLNSIEDEHNIKIIYACDAGSKAWGSDSENSDYDIRYIYLSPRSRYQNANFKDHIENELSEKYDIHGYDISKIIELIKKQDYTPFEWLTSPIKYSQTTHAKKLTNCLNTYSFLQNLLKSYKRTAISDYNGRLQNVENPQIKAYLMLLKHIMTIEYIDRKNDFPPLTYQELFDFYQDENKEVAELGRNLLKIKKQGLKKAEIPRIPALDKFIQQKIEEYSTQNLTKTPLNEDECRKLDDFFEQTINSPEFDRINKIQPTQDDLERFKLYPKDNDYRKKIMTDMGLSNDEFLSIKSIIGPQEFKDMVFQFNSTPEVYSNGANHQLTNSKIVNVINGTFRANLHTHTLHSDGTMSVQQLLDSAAKYADKVAKINQNKDANCKLQPFTIAITDHNTLEGCKEAVDIIRKNPDKYKNLRVVLGCELSTSEKSAGDFTPNKPYQIHLLAQCVNPFDAKMNNELQSKTNKNNPCYISIGTMKEAIDILSDQPDALIGYAHPLEHQSYKKAPSKNKITDIITKLIENFAHSCLNRTAFVENYYQSYDTELGNNVEVQTAVKKYCDENGLLSTGGLDTHGNSIFFR